MTYVDEAAKPDSPMGQAAYKAVKGDYLVNFPAAPDSGATAGIPDGLIMAELERIGNDLDCSMSKVAKSLNIELSSLVLRVYANPLLMEFYKTIRRARAQLVREERDRLSQKLCEAADDETLTPAQMKAYSLRIQILDRDLKTLDRELFGSGEKAHPTPKSTTKAQVIEAQAEFIPEITTSLEHGKSASD